jgi:hypothetical protein
LPSATHCAPLDGDTAVILTLTRSLDGKSATLYLGDGMKTQPITDITEQEQQVHTAVEKGLAEGKKAVLLKAEKKVRLADLFRIATAATAEGIKLNVGVLEKDTR